MALIRVSDLTVHYGAVLALDSIGLKLNRSEIVALIGANGAGKSTCIKAMAGALGSYGGRISEGVISLNGRDVTGMTAHELVGRGLAMVPEGRRVFGELTVQENLQLGALATSRRSNVSASIESALAVFPALKARLKQQAATLSGGEQQMLAIGRALLMEPMVLMADEPSLGLSPNYVDTIFDKLLEINQAGTSIVLVEQNARMALEISHRAYVFAAGRIELEGESQRLLGDSRLGDVFFGG